MEGALPFRVQHARPGRCARAGREPRQVPLDRDAQFLLIALGSLCQCHEAAGSESETIDAWELDAYCPIHGAVQELPGGHVLTTCPASGTVREYAPGAAGYSWQLQATCRESIPVQFSRGIPIEL